MGMVSIADCKLHHKYFFNYSIRIGGIDDKDNSKRC